MNSRFMNFSFSFPEKKRKGYSVSESGIRPSFTWANRGFRCSCKGSWCLLYATSLAGYEFREKGRPWNSLMNLELRHCGKAGWLSVEIRTHARICTHGYKHASRQHARLHVYITIHHEMFIYIETESTYTLPWNYMIKAYRKYNNASD